MKKRILALALAGTTAFSVFGAAMSANAASTHTVAGNDAYTTYAQGTVNYDPASNVTTGTSVESYVAKVDVPANMPTSIPKQAWDAKTTSGDNYKVTINGTEYIAGTSANLNAWLNAVDGNYTTWLNYQCLKDIYPTVVGATAGNVYKTTVNGEEKYYNLATATAPTGYTKVTAGLFVGKSLTDAEVIPYNSDTVKRAIAEYVENGGKTYKLIVTDNYDLVNSKYIAATGAVVSSGDLSTATLSRTGETVSSGTIYVNDYWVGTDVLPNATLPAYATAFVATWGGANMQYRGLTANVYSGVYENKANAQNLITVLDAIDTYGKQNTNSTINKLINEADANTNPYFSGRSTVYQEFGEFLVEIGLADYYDGTYYGGVHINADLNGDNVVNYKDEDAFLAGYSYTYSGVDLYNFKGLVSDIFAAVKNDTYKTYSSSHIVYLMQQYDKYVDGSFIGDEENGESKWAELLISALEAVDSTDFSAAAQYTAFDRYRTSVINAYEDALTGSARMAAIKNLYNAVVSTNYRTPAANYTDLTGTIASLYFNVNKAPKTYQDAVIYNDTNAANILYGYEGFELTPNGKYYNNAYGVKATYPLYPMQDYFQLYNENVVYTGNKADAAYTAGYSTDAYEWFWNVYQLATTIAGKNATATAQGIVDTVNEALAAAVEELEPTATATAAMNGVLEEVVDSYTDPAYAKRVKEESDYVAKYWNAYQQGLDFADSAKGKYQNTYAIEIAAITGNTLGFDSAQISVTKAIIADLNKKITEGKNALTALKNDKDNYNAAQAIALNTSISAAENLVKLYNGKLYTSAIYEDYQSENGNFSTLNGDKDQITLSDVAAAKADIDAAIEFKNVIQGWSKNDNGKYQYGEGNEYFQDGWKQIGATWYYFEKGEAVQSDWRKIDGKWYFLNSDCGAAIGWKKVDGTWYYFDRSCAMKTGWLQTDGNWYYLKPSGAMATGWQTINGKSYYFSEKDNEYGGFALGQMLYNTTTPDGYKVGADGAWVK